MLLFVSVLNIVLDIVKNRQGGCGDQAFHEVFIKPQDLIFG